MKTTNTEMPKMSYEECKLAFDRHVQHIKKMCPKSKGLTIGKVWHPLGDGLHIEVEPYFLADFMPYSGKMIITGNDEIVEFFRHVFTCKECREVRL